MKKLSFINKIPEFSDRNFTYASYVCGALAAASSLFFIYEMFTADDFGIHVQWNIFKSSWFTFLFIIGLLLAIVRWGAFGHWSFKTVKVYEDRYGNEIAEEDSDFGSVAWGSLLFPLIGHFAIEPIVYACLIYYPLMCVFAILGLVLPYVITLALIGIVVAMFMGKRYAAKVRYHSLVLVLVTVLLGVGLTWVSVKMEKAKTPASVELIDNTTTTNDESLFDSADAPAVPTENDNSDLFD